jgi:1-acyl-sn-glycerol-3-phosphate acyltransferase
MILYLIQLLVGLAVAIWFGFTSPIESVLSRIAFSGLVFLGVNLAVLIFFLIVFVVTVLSLSKTDGKQTWKHQFLATYIAYVFIYLYQVRLRIDGKENIPKSHRFVIYSNHVEYLDPMYIKYAFRRHPVAFVSKDSLFRVPMIKHLLHFMGGIPISRRVGDRTALDSINTAIAAVENGHTIAIYPEGTRSHCNTMKPFRAGSFRLAIRAEADIVPVAMYDVHKSHFRVRLIPATLRMAILPPITKEEYAGMDTLEVSELVRERIQTQMDAYEAKKQSKG